MGRKGKERRKEGRSLQHEKVVSMATVLLDESR